MAVLAKYTISKGHGFMKELVLLSILLGIYAYLDAKERRLPLWILIVGIVSVFSVCFADKQFQFPYAVSGLFAGVFLMLVSVISRRQIGMADGIVFCMTGLCLDIWQNMTLLLVSLILLSVPAAVFFVQGKKKKELPFLVGVFFGYLILWAGGGFYA